MYQVNFSDQSIVELNRLDKVVQMELIEALSGLTQDQIKHAEGGVGHLNRDGKVFYRLRAGDFRVYFEVRDDCLFSHYILHQHSLADFVFRFKLPFTEEQSIEQHQSFWKYLESLKR
jgi:mRNA interferase RelE/StbE